MNGKHPPLEEIFTRLKNYFNDYSEHNETLATQCPDPFPGIEEMIREENVAINVLIGLIHAIDIPKEKISELQAILSAIWNPDKRIIELMETLYVEHK